MNRVQFLKTICLLPAVPIVAKLLPKQAATARVTFSLQPRSYIAMAAMRAKERDVLSNHKAMCATSDGNYWVDAANDTITVDLRPTGVPHQTADLIIHAR
jgi:hypothetical protein